MSINPTDLSERLDRIIQAIGAIPQDKQDDEDRQVSEGLVALAQAHQKNLAPNGLARSTAEQREQIFAQAIHFCDEADALLAESAAHDAAA